MRIIEAESERDYAAARDLIAAYQRWLGVDLEFQGFSKELETLSVMYGPPDGVMLLAEEGGVGIECVALRRLVHGDAEMKSMFVLPAYQGRGIGSKLTQEAITVARRLGHWAIRLDTVPRLDRAMRVYEKAGFTRIPPYRHNPDPDAVFMEFGLG
jgi:GNAT superfamily N-acetyltransferase